jgi:hypothetical protein
MQRNLWIYVINLAESLFKSKDKKGLLSADPADVYCPVLTAGCHHIAELAEWII